MLTRQVSDEAAFAASIMDEQAPRLSLTDSAVILGTRLPNHLTDSRYSRSLTSLTENLTQD